MTDVARVHLYDFQPQSHLYFTVIFPQFLDVHQPLAMQFVIMDTKFIVLEWVTIAIDASIGLYLRKVLQTARGQRNFNRTARCSRFGITDVTQLDIDNPNKKRMVLNHAFFIQPIECALLAGYIAACFHHSRTQIINTHRVHIALVIAGDRVEVLRTEHIRRGFIAIRQVDQRQFDIRFNRLR